MFHCSEDGVEKEENRIGHEDKRVRERSLLFRDFLVGFTGVSSSSMSSSLSPPLLPLPPCSIPLATGEVVLESGASEPGVVSYRQNNTV